MTISHATDDAPLCRRLVMFAHRRVVRITRRSLPDWAMRRSNEAVAVNVQCQLAALIRQLAPNR